MRIFVPSPDQSITLRDLAHVHEHLHNGGLVILPTETGYLLGADGNNDVAIRQLFQCKDRAPDHPIHLAVDSVKSALRHADLCPRAQRALKALSPGPLSVIGPAQPGVPLQLQAGTGTVGVRIPDHAVTLQILRETGMAVTATSANRSGLPAEVSLARIQRQFGDVTTAPWLAVKDDHRRYETPSTLMRWDANTLQILRQGPISEAEIREVSEEALPG